MSTRSVLRRAPTARQLAAAEAGAAAEAAAASAAAASDAADAAADAAGPAPLVLPEARRMTSITTAARIGGGETDLRRLELFHDCGDPRVRDCVCRVYEEGCGKCSECVKNKVFQRETGQKGQRVCRLATGTDYVKLQSFKIEYPRDLTRLRPGSLLPHTQRQLHFMRRVFRYALHRLRDEMLLQEQQLSNRSRLLMSAEDPAAQVHDGVGAGAVSYIDTELVHGRTQRIRRDQVVPMVLPLVTESTRGIRRIEAIRQTIFAHWKAFCGAQIAKVGRGYIGRLRAKRKRVAVLRHFGALRIQSAYRGYYDRRYVVPVLLDQLRNRCARRIALAWIRFSRGRTLRARLRARMWRIKRVASTKIQAVWRGHFVRQRLGALRAAAADAKALFEAARHRRLQAARARREHIKHRAATTLQRVWRGTLGRRAAYQRRQAGLISNLRVRELADRFLTSGDLWGFIASVNADYQRVETEKNRELVKARAFVDQVIRVRQENTEKAWAGWRSFQQREAENKAQRPPSHYERGVREAGGGSSGSGGGGGSGSGRGRDSGASAAEASLRGAYGAGSSGRPASRASAVSAGSVAGGFTARSPGVHAHAGGGEHSGHGGTLRLAENPFGPMQVRRVLRVSLCQRRPRLTAALSPALVSRALPPSLPPHPPSPSCAGRAASSPWARSCTWATSARPSTSTR